MAYLLLGYCYTATEHYDIKWTMPHCVLTLKLIEEAGKRRDWLSEWKSSSEANNDESDASMGGAHLNEQLSAEQRQSILPQVPSFVEVCGFSYFYGGFLVGPQFTMRSYQRLVAGELTDCPGQTPNSILPAVKRVCLGLLCLSIYTLGSPFFPDSYFLSDDFKEGVCILSGLGYNGRDSRGVVQWDACANMKVWQFETTPLFTGTIASFNINTNAWVARHVFKRLKFLGNKMASQSAALFFLAIWHGLHSGYLLCFLMEFIIVTAERQVYSSVYFCGHVFFFTAMLIMPYLRRALVPRKKEKGKKEE
ncbi:UNVERIFIED_CONTAM: hypothetical protein FKN15_025654 [Acipenser sinensis]